MRGNESDLLMVQEAAPKAQAGLEAQAEAGALFIIQQISQRSL